MPTGGATALVLGGGGARGAYQAGVIRGIARRYPDIEFPILTGISAGAISTAFLASHGETFAEAAEELVRLWLSVTPEQVYRVDATSLLRNVVRWGWRIASGGMSDVNERTRALVDTAPLAELLRRALPRHADGAIIGIERNVARGRLQAVALSATSYTTGQSVTWVHGNGVKLWQRPQRRSENARLGIEHVMASTALPLLFPAVRVGGEWYGDGGIRLTAPLSPALHLGAARILTISTRHPRSRAEADVPQIVGYPPPAQVLGVLYNAVFLDLIDQDILRLQLINQLLANAPEARRSGMREVDILVLRPSRDLGRMAREYEPRLPPALRFLTRGWGTRRTTSPDVLSLMMFQADYLRALIDLGERDVWTQKDRIDAFLDGAGTSASRASASDAVVA
ncbi:MAG TPA: patatin-like phospholipase family protein [Gemmatimonadaceae bacterium]